MLLALLTVGAALRWVSPERVQDLHPRPDAVEYEEGARRLARGDGYWLYLGTQRYPPRYPIGFSALLTPASFVWGEDHPGSAVRIVLATAMIAIGLTWVVARRAGGGVAAAVAALLLVTAPLHVRLSKAVLSDVPSSTAVAAIALLVLLAAARGASSRMWIAVGVAAGISATLRIPNVLVLVPVPVVLVYGSIGTNAQRLRGIVFLIMGALLGLLPLFVGNWWYFGSPLVTGYGYWVPESFFGFRYALGAPAGGGTDANALFYARTLLGKGELYAWPVAVLIGAGVVVGLRQPGTPRALAILAIGYAGALFAFQSLFFWQAERFLLPAIPLLTAVAGLSLSAAAAKVTRIFGLLMLLLAAGAMSGYSFSPPDRDFGEVAALRELRMHTERNAVVVAHTNAFFFERFLRADDADRLWIPLGLDAWQLTIRLHRLQGFGTVPGGGWMLDPIDDPLRSAIVQARVRTLLEAGRPVYVSSLRDFDVPFFPQLLAALRAEFNVRPHGNSRRWTVYQVLRP